MPRIPRKDLNTPFIHVMVQGVNKEFIFDDKKYLRKYLKLILNNVDENKFTVLAYCMMNNHAHFLFYVEDFVEFEKYMHKNNLFFAQQYNTEKHRCGVLFRNRYRVEPIYDINHLKNCIKYIHNNPVKANMVKQCKDYKYSSFNDYMNNKGVAKNRIVKDLYGEKCNYKALFDSTYERKFIDVYDDTKIEDYINDGINEFSQMFNYNLIQIFSEKEVLRKMVCFLKDDCNLLYREIRDYLGMTRGTLDKILKTNC